MHEVSLHGFYGCYDHGSSDVLNRDCTCTFEIHFMTGHGFIDHIHILEIPAAKEGGGTRIRQ